MVKKLTLCVLFARILADVQARVETLLGPARATGGFENGAKA